MPDEPAENETVFNPATQRDGVRRVPQERPQRAPLPERGDRDPDGPKTAHFDPDDLPDSEVEAAASSGGPRVAGRVAGGKRNDETLKRFLDS